MPKKRFNSLDKNEKQLLIQTIEKYLCRCLNHENYINNPLGKNEQHIDIMIASSIFNIILSLNPKYIPEHTFVNQLKNNEHSGNELNLIIGSLEQRLMNKTMNPISKNHLITTSRI